MATIDLTFKQFIEDIGRDEALVVLLDGGHDEAWASTIIAITMGEADGDSKFTIERERK